MATLLLASHNSGKLAELSALLEPLGVTCRSAAGLGLHQPEEVETTFVGNARIKARAAFEATGLPALADDSGFAVEALNGAPGVRTADWCITAEGTTDFDLGMDRIHKAVAQTGTAPPWRARLVCALLLIVPDGSEHVFEGVVSGEFVWPKRGEHGRALEPIFAPDGAGGRTFGEMHQKEKLAISHRAQAFEAFRDFLAANPAALAGSGRS